MKLLTKTIIFSLFSTYLYSSNITPAYNGNTGIFETPDARIMPDWSMRFFYNNDAPYSYYGAAVTPLPFLEANFHMTQVDGIAGFTNNDGYGDYKDKSLSFKLLINEEKEYYPAVVFGAEDIWGTSLYSSKYIVASKNIGYFDLSLGYAKGRLGGEDLRKYTANSQNSGSSNNNALNFLKNADWSGGKPFGSVVFNATPSLSLMAEYSPIDYSKDKINPFLNGKRYELTNSKFNYGLKYKLGDNSIVSLSYQRGNKIAFGYTYQFGFNRTGVFDHLPDNKWRATDKIREDYDKLNKEELTKKLTNEVAAENFANVSTVVNENKIWSEITNTRYNNDLKAVSRALTTLDEVAPKKYDTFYLTLNNDHIPKKTFKINRQEFSLFEKEKVSDEYISSAVEISNNTKEKYKEFSNEKINLFKIKNVATKRFKWDISPKIRTYFNHVDQPFAIKLSARAEASYEITDNLSVSGSIEHPLYNNGKDLSTEALESEELSLRSDITNTFTYNDTQMPHLSLMYKDKLFDDSFYKIEAGYLEYAFAGLDLEWYKPLFDERLGIGLQYQKVYKRKYDNMFKLKNNLSYDAAFVNLFYQLSPKYNINLGVKAGKFLAGDKGVSVNLSRHYKDFTLGAFATFTDSEDIFQNSQNKGYIDKGVFIQFPLEVLTYKNLRKRLVYVFKPWSRDVGQYSGTQNSLYPMNNSENNTQIMKNNINYLKY